jgi:hypothetical protein
MSSVPPRSVLRPRCGDQPLTSADPFETVGVNSRETKNNLKTSENLAALFALFVLFAFSRRFTLQYQYYSLLRSKNGILLA